MKWQLFVAASVLTARVFGMDAMIIGGTKINPSDVPWVKKLSIENAGCTGSVVGPKAILTAAHCARNMTGAFKVDDQAVKGEVIRHPGYPARDMDMALIILDDASAALVNNVKPVSVGGTWTRGLVVQLVGYGCTQTGGGSPDGNLYAGEATTRTVQTDYAITNGDATCFGDSGGPSFVVDADGHLIQNGVASKGNLRDDSYYFRTDAMQAQQFLRGLATTKKVEICGINLDCR
jgi:secreted trypsin-like serine protease